ncbi:S41 family peptidase [Vibrio sp. CAU 1672]|uniref:S41 family peptidase n=1 Tax=Vibrio sp. CAU 1672 TaxID=3032594 RepID=UPI0023DB7CF9|nr:S41 family peptidase [Vibrio sp. CAU 1672]MDF2152309.1 S41 family peptidase [Vibrio sp. CAU 1672]
MKVHYSALLAALPIALLPGCGGGGENTTFESSLNGWVQGVYNVPSAELANLCSTPRTGLDPYAGNTAYPDKAGSAMNEKMFLRAFSNETYLWYDEIQDQNPQQFNTVLDYFHSLKTTETTASGQDKDRFHFTVPYDEYIKSSQSGVVAGFGFNWSFLNATAPRDIRIAYTEQDSPAALEGVNRGDKLLMINNVDVVSTNNPGDIDFINASLFAPELNTSYQFTFENVDGMPKTVTLTAQDVMTSPVKNATVIEHGDKKVGYIQYNAFEPTAQAPLITAFSMLSEQQIDEMVVDLRYNGGGLVWQSAQVGYMLSGADSNRVFSALHYNDKIMKEVAPGENIYPFLDVAIDWGKGVLTKQQLPSVNAQRVYVLTTGNTASASELLINALRGIDVEVIQIGTPSTGKPYGFAPEQNCGTMYYTIQFKSANEKGFGDFADGFIPTPKSQTSATIGLDEKVEGCLVADDLTKPLGDSSEGMLAAALNYISTGECPALPAASYRAMSNLNSHQEGAINDLRSPFRTEAIHVDLK